MSYITTYTGKHFSYANPTPDMIDIRDIALGLSHECRFAGQIVDFYSVAQHSVECSFIVPSPWALEALLHDAAEAYCKDIPSPLKRELSDYRAVEKSVDAVIRQRFNLPKLESAEVKQADLTMLATEKKSFDIDNGIDWPIIKWVKPRSHPVSPISPNAAYQLFMSRFESLTSEDFQHWPTGQVWS